jgi:predicted lipid-binding transport protein (Tim44 family)
MRNLLVALFIAVLGGALAAGDAEARRLGSSRSVGAQRNVTPPPAAAKPAPQQAAPAQQAPAGNKWLPILGGLALGGMLGYLFGGNGLLGILLLALLAMVAVVGIRALMRRRREAPQPMQYAGMNERMTEAPPASTQAPMSSSSVPAGFDAERFLRAAKMNFVKLQLANDFGKLDEIREFTTGAMFEELRKDVLERGAQGQQTDVLALNADLLEVATDKGEHWASVRFSGEVRETPGTNPVGFEEVWNLVKPADGSSGWLLAGIQQMH